MALLTLGGALKRKEMLSARFGDILSELYLLVRRAETLAGRGPPAGRISPRSNGAWRAASRPSRTALRKSSANLPNRFVAVILKFLIQPFGARVLGPSDRVVHQCAQLVLEPSAARDRLTPDLSHRRRRWRRRAAGEGVPVWSPAAEDISQTDARRAPARLERGGEEGRHHARPRARSLRPRMKPLRR